MLIWLKVKKVLLVLVFGSLGLMVLLMTFNFLSLTSPLPLPENPAFLDTTLVLEERINNLLSYMTIEEKIGQMALVEKNSIFIEADIATYGLGGILSGAGAKPETSSAEDWLEMTEQYQSAARASRLGIPLLYGADAIHGHAHVPGATVFPHAIGFGAAGDPLLVEQVAQATAREMMATGVNWNYAPNLDLPNDIRWGRVYETFSDDPVLAGVLGAAYVRGLQSVSLDNNLTIGVLATPKHFVGLGAMEWGTSKNENYAIDQGATPVSETKLREQYLPPFNAAIEAGALSIMIGLNTWGEKETVISSKYLLTTVLKEELKFKGFIVSDWYGVYEQRDIKFLAMVNAINAGTDMVMLPYDYKMFTRDMLWARRLGLISEERIDDAVRRILRAKFAVGLFDNQDIQPSRSLIGASEHRALARKAVAESLVLLKNESDLLPITNEVKRIRVAGSAANDVGKQSGAWTIEWQGITGNWLPQSTSLLEGIKQKAGPNAVVEYGNELSTEISDLGIAIVGEEPYAEGWGDREIPTLSTEDLAVIAELKRTSKKVLVIIVSGRPLLITDDIDGWDGVVAAWLPGSEGGGLADVLFGEKNFKGTLPLAWPATLEQLPVSLDGTTKNSTPVLFPRGYGLTTGTSTL